MSFKLGQKIIDVIRRKPVEQAASHYGIRHIYTGKDGQDLLIKELNRDKPSMICRFGSTELSVVMRYYNSLNKKFIVFPPKYKVNISDLSGFFPATDYYLSRFSAEFIELIKNIDVIGVWFKPGEEELLEKYGKQAKLVYLEDLNVKNLNHGYIQQVGAVPSEKIFSSCFKHKKVLVIHPFEETIKSQYQKRELLFDNKDTLPEFELKTLKSVQSLADNKNLPYSDWFEALDYMKNQISQIDFDIAVIGCGAYGIFLADYVKSLGKKAVHLGGATQLLFGIIGKRWEDEYKMTFNENWVRPSALDKPKGAEKVEGGCYW